MSAIRPELALLRQGAITALYAKTGSNTETAKALGFTPSNVTQALAQHGLTGEHRPDVSKFNPTETALLGKIINALKAHGITVGAIVHGLSGDLARSKATLDAGLVSYNFEFGGKPGMLRPNPQAIARPRRSDAKTTPTPMKPPPVPAPTEATAVKPPKAKAAKPKEDPKPKVKIKTTIIPAPKKAAAKKAAKPKAAPKAKAPAKRAKK